MGLNVWKDFRLIDVHKEITVTRQVHLQMYLYLHSGILFVNLSDTIFQTYFGFPSESG